MSLSPEDIRFDILRVLKFAPNGRLNTFQLYEALKQVSDFYDTDCKSEIDGNISEIWRKQEIEKVGKLDGAWIWKIRR